MDKVKSKTPELRFPEFDDSWIGKSLGTEAKFLKGKGISKSDIAEGGKIECIRYGELYTEYNELIKDIKSRTNLNQNELVLSEFNDVIIPASGETHIDIATASCVLKKGVALGGDLNIIKSKNNGVFLAYYLNNKKRIEIARLAQGNSVVHLYSSQLKSLNLLFPKLNEQQKIASFLTAVDYKIQQLTKKKELLGKYKKGVMQKVFSQEIRFKDDDGNDYPAWERKKLGEVGKFVSGVGFTEVEQGGNEGLPFFKVSDMNLKDNESLMQSANNYVSDEQIKRLKYKPIANTAIIFAKVGAAIFLERKRIARKFLIDNNMMAFIPQLNIGFAKQLFETLRLSKYAQVGALPSYNSSDLATIKVIIPSITEQEKISDFLSSIDNKIDSVNTQLEKTKEFKKGLLQQMFV